MKLFKVYKDNEKLKKALEFYKKQSYDVGGQNNALFKKIAYYEDKINKLEDENQELRYKVCDLLKENTRLLEENINKLKKES